jgi:ketosteroid isomerase-like protein
VSRTAHFRTLFRVVAIIGVSALLGALSAPSLAIEPPDGLVRQVSLLGDTALPGEPVVLRLTWRNTSARTLECRDDQLLRITVQRAGDGAARPLWLLRKPLKAGEAAVRLAPGKAFSRQVLVVLGRSEDRESSPPEFVFPAAGKYRLAIEGIADPPSLTVTVQDLASVDDLAARHLWTVGTAGLLVASARDAAGPPGLARIYTERPLSRYAPYAMWAHVQELAAFDGFRNGPRAAMLLETLLDRYGSFPLRDEAFKALVELYHAMNDGEAARETAEDFARAMPAGDAVAALKQAYGDTFDALGPHRPAPPAGTAAVRATLDLTGADALPAAVRPVFEAYWKSVAAGNLEALPALLARDFMGDYGPRGAFISALGQHRMGATAGAMQVAVSKAAMASSFDRPHSLPRGMATSWHGNLCVIEGSVTIKWTIPGVAGGDSLRAPRACWVFNGYPDGTWKLVSETVPSRNLLAGALGQTLTRRLARTFAAWRPSDGQRERSVFEEVKERLNLADKVVDGRTQWVGMQVRMGGAARDEVQLIGQVRLLMKPAPAEPAKETWVERMVAIYMLLGDGDTLVLKEWKFYEPPGRSPAR